MSVSLGSAIGASEEGADLKMPESCSFLKPSAAELAKEPAEIRRLRRVVPLSSSDNS